MYLKIFFVFLFAISIIVLVAYFVNNNSSFFGNNTDEAGSATHLPDTIQTTSGESFSDEPIIDNPDTKTINPGFFELTNNENMFGLYYDKDSGSITIILYNENTKLARSEAEKYLLDSLPYSKDELCKMSITVTTNEYVNPRWAGQELGLSFCTGAVSL